MGVGLLEEGRVTIPAPATEGTSTGMLTGHSQGVELGGGTGQGDLAVGVGDGDPGAVSERLGVRTVSTWMPGLGGRT